jgi:uncharacterized membrane protein
MIVLLSLCFASAVHAQTEAPITDPALAPPTPDRFFRAEVIKILSDVDADIGIPDATAFSQTVQVRLLNGEYAGKEVEVEYGGLKKANRLVEGEKIIVSEAGGERDMDVFFVFDKYRLTPLYAIIAFFCVLAIVFARWRGVTSILGLALSVLVLASFIVPQLLAGKNVLLVVLGGALFISTTSIYLAHGFNRRTTVALGSTLITICIAMALSVMFVGATKLLGVGSEEAFYLQSMPGVANLNLKGLLLGGIIIGTLGVLDDVTTTQAAAVDEIAKANPRLTRRELIQRGASVGREHITSLVNTLVLAYAGAALPSLLLFTVYERPFWVVMNTEVIAEEIVRTLVGSIALMCAVPITTALAAYFLPGHGSATTDRSGRLKLNLKPGEATLDIHEGKS